MVQIKLVPDTTHCIETVARTEHDRLMRSLLRTGTVENHIAQQIELLRTFLENADFKALRKQSDEYLLAGSGFIVTFASDVENVIPGISNIQEGKYQQGEWVGQRWLNGDESHQGRHIRLPFGDFGIQYVRIYGYN